MGIIIWIIFGALTGWIASVIMKTNYKQGFVMDVIMGILGSVLGGFLMNLVGESGVTGFNLYSLLVAVFGATVLILIGRQLKKA